MRLLYIADNDFSFHDGEYYYGKLNKENTDQYLKYFDQISYIGRNDYYYDGQTPITNSNNIRLVSRYGIRELKRAMRDLKSEYDVVLVRNGFLGLFASKYAKEFGKTLISYCGSDPYEFYMAKGSFLNKLIAIAWGRFEGEKMQRADYAYYCTNTLYEKYPCKCPYMICSNVKINIEEGVLEKRINRIKTKNKKIKLGLIGSVAKTDHKGITTVLKAMSLLDSRYSFDWVGMDDYKKFDSIIDDLGLKERVNFLGFLTNRNSINEWLDSVDIYLQPSLSEGLPRATVEAMGRACPAIASHVGGMRDLLTDEYLIVPKDYKMLADKIIFLSDEEEMIKAAKTNVIVAANYTEDIRASKMDSFFYGIVNK